MHYKETLRYPESYRKMSKVKYHEVRIRKHIQVIGSYSRSAIPELQQKESVN